MKLLKVLTLLIITGTSVCMAETFEIKPENCVIVSSEENKKLITVAEEELSKHLQLITGEKIEIAKDSKIPEGKYPVYLGIPAPEDKDELKKEEARWTVTPEATYIYGKDAPGSPGTQFAVYDFLENEFGVHWIEPGDKGIVYKKQNPLTLKVAKGTWSPALVFRTIRAGIRTRRPIDAPKNKKYNKRVDETFLWLKRMKAGGSRPGGGHSFTSWWKKYGKTHPEYFALTESGKREAVMLPEKTEKESFEFVKICPSNPDVAKQIVSNWLPYKDSPGGKYINVCMNDGVTNFCLCENCRKLDVIEEGEKFGDHLTDRYVYLANEVIREARKHNPNVKVTMYAYMSTIQAPRKIKLEPGITVQVVPYVIPLDIAVTNKLLGDWKKAGATELALRPNYHFKYHKTPLPMGFEKQMFDVFQTAVKNGTISADYDSLMHNWPISGIADYILLKAMSDPSKPFEYWEDEYYTAFGPASEDIKKYFRYWRNEIWEKRLLPNMDLIIERGRCGDFFRGVMWSLAAQYKGLYKPEGCDQYYTDEDFDKTDAILQEAMKKD